MRRTNGLKINQRQGRRVNNIPKEGSLEPKLCARFFRKLSMSRATEYYSLKWKEQKIICQRGKKNVHQQNAPYENHEVHLGQDLNIYDNFTSSYHY